MWASWDMTTPYEHYGYFSYGDLDDVPPLLPLKSISELEAVFILTDCAELDLVSSLSSPGLEIDSLPEGTGTGLP